MFIFSFFYYQLWLFQWLESTNSFLHISGDSKDSQKTWKVPLKWSRDKLESKSRALTFACETVIYDIKLACVTSNNSKQNDILPCRTVFKQLKVRKTTPIPKEMRPINNGKANNTRESRCILTVDTNSSRQNNSIHDLTWRMSEARTVV